VAGFSTWVSRWPRSPPLELPLEEAETVAACLRYVESLDREIAAVKRWSQKQALRSPPRKLAVFPAVCRPSAAVPSRRELSRYRSRRCR
jgi:hypothetical protein